MSRESSQPEGVLDAIAHTNQMKEKLSETAPTAIRQWIDGLSPIDTRILLAAHAAGGDVVGLRELAEDLATTVTVLVSRYEDLRKEWTALA